MGPPSHEVLVSLRELADQRRPALATNTEPDRAKAEQHHCPGRGLWNCGGDGGKLGRASVVTLAT